MNILMVGVGSGSWAMRGVQLGGAIGARVTVSPTAADWAWADLVVLVKRAAIRWRVEARRLKVPVVWDVLDFWAQPEDNGLGRDEMIAKVKAIQQACRATTLIGATRAMAADIGGAYLPHHCRVGLQPARPQDKPYFVGYEGQRKYLGRWANALAQASAMVGLQFIVNPTDIRDVDILVAFRDGRWDGWPCRQWKSGIKHVNAIVSGRPIASQSSAAFEDLRPEGKVVDAPVVPVIAAIDCLVDALGVEALRESREEAYEYAVNTASTYQLPAVAREYVGILQQAAMVTA